MSEFAPSPPPSRSGPPPQPCAPPSPSMMVAPQPYGSTEEERTLGMLCHLLSLLTGFLGPLILWLVKKDSSRFVDHHGREALNFQLTVLLVTVCLGALTFVLIFFVIGIVFIPVMMVVAILAIVAEILAAVAAQRGEWHRYPCSIRFF